MNDAKTKKKPLYILFIDFSSAYDRVIRSKLYKRLADKKILDDDEL